MLVFVLHPDLDVLAAIVGTMRDRGLESIHAAEAATLIERAANNEPTVLALPEMALGVEGAAEIAALRAALPGVPEVAIPDVAAEDDAAIGRIVDTITSAIVAARSSEIPLVPGAGEVRGDLSQIPLPDLLQLLCMGRKTGTLTVTTLSAAGEMRLVEGDLVDAMFRRAEGMKAVVRLLGEREGAFHFAPDTAPALRRILEPMSTILMDGTRQTDEIRRLQQQLGLPTEGRTLALQVEFGPFEAVNSDGRVERPSMLHGEAIRARFPGDPAVEEVARLLVAPRTLEDLLDDLSRDDLGILAALWRLDAAGVLRRLPIGDLRPSLAGPEGMVVLRGLARRLRPRGYRTAGRLVLAGQEGSVQRARQAIARLAEAVPGSDSSAEFSADRLIEGTATLQLGESVALDVLTIIDRADIAPAFPMVLSGAIGVVTLDRPSAALAAIVEELEVALVDARSVVDAGTGFGEEASQAMEAEDHASTAAANDVAGAGPGTRRKLDPGDPVSIAAIIRGAIEGMGGS